MVKINPISKEELEKPLGLNAPKSVSNPFEVMGISKEDIENTPDSVMNAVDILVAYGKQTASKLWEIKTTAAEAEIAHKFVVTKTAKSTGKTYSVDLLETGLTAANKASWYGKAASARCRTAHITATGSEYNHKYASPEYYKVYEDTYQRETRKSINAMNGGNNE